MWDRTDARPTMSSLVASVVCFGRRWDSLGACAPANGTTMAAALEPSRNRELLLTEFHGVSPSDDRLPQPNSPRGRRSHDDHARLATPFVATPYSGHGGRTAQDAGRKRFRPLVGLLTPSPRRTVGRSPRVRGWNPTPCAAQTPDRHVSPTEPAGGSRQRPREPASPRPRRAPSRPSAMSGRATPQVRGRR
jgi:hypothetical protein